MNEEWMSITAAAERLTAAGDRVDRSTLSRYLKQHSEALQLKRDGKSSLVDFIALSAHRSENIRIKSSAPNLRESATRSSTRFAGSQSDGAARKAQADAELREMDLAERRKQLTIVAEVDQAGRDAVTMMQNAFERAFETEAQALSLKYGWDERLVRVALKNFAKSGLRLFNQIVLEKLDAMRRREESGDETVSREAEVLSLQ